MTSPHPRTAKEIQDWLVSQLADLIYVDPDEIDARETFDSYGLASREAVMLSGDLEEWLGQRISPTIVYEYPTIEALARHLAGEPEDKEPLPQAAPTQDLRDDSIAVIGLGCRFPGADGPDAFWQLLQDGVDAITEVPPERWDVDAYYDPDPEVPGKMYTRWGGFLEKVDQFDPQFFGISPREAAQMDPQQRLLLEVTWEALEHAGQAAADMAGSQTGVFIGIGNNEYGNLSRAGDFIQDINPYSGTGNAYSVAAGRLSYALGLQGPAVAVDTACSSSLVAAHLACQSLNSGECDLALAGGVSVILSPEGTVYFSKLRVMASDGRCKTFSAAADGYVRSEGCGIVVLKRLSDALADGDNVLAVIRGSAINHDGRSQGLTAPNGLAQQAVIRRALAKAGVASDQIDYVEAHGTGTALGDPIEVQALAAVLGERRSARKPLWIGSVKTNIGHAEAAAGVAGLIKVILALKHGELPPSLHLGDPNPLIDWQNLPVAVPTERVPWPDDGKRRVAGTSSFGFSGTNVHIVVEEAPPQRRPDNAASVSDQVYLLPLSARGPEALQAVAATYQGFLTDETTRSALADICYTASVRRSHHDYRLALVSQDREEMVEQLEAFRQGEPHPGLSSGRHVSTRQNKIVFVFPGQGSQWLGMGRELLERELVFRETLVQCDRALQRLTDWSLLEELAVDASATRLAEEIDLIQPTLFAIQVGLAALWRSWGIEPDAVVGHSMGEVAAAYVAGALSLDDAAHIICLRSQLMRQVSGQGAMAVVGLSLAETEELLVGMERLSAAVSNGPSSTVISGDPVAIEAVVEDLADRGIFCRKVKVDVASHSPQMDPLRSELVRDLQGLAPRAGAVPIYSTVTGVLADGPDLGATYWGDNLRRPVRFWPVVQQLVEKGHDIFIEISPHPILVNTIQKGLDEMGQRGTVLPSLRRQVGEQAVMLGSLGALYAVGYSVVWRKRYPAGGRPVHLPAYPWQHARFWLETDGMAAGGPRVREYRGGPETHPLLGWHLNLADGSGRHVWEASLNPQFLPYLNDHRVWEAVVLPASAYLEMALGAAAKVFGDKAFALEDVEFRRALFLPEQGAKKVQVILSSDREQGASLHVYSSPTGSEGSRASWTLHMVGRVRLIQDAPAPTAAEPFVPADVQARCQETLSPEDYYRELGQRNVRYGPAFQHIEQIWRRDGETLVQVSVPELRVMDGNYQVHPTILDNCLQVMVAAIPQEMVDDGDLYMPTRIEQVRVYGRPHSRLWGHARLEQDTTQDGRSVEGDARLLDDAGRTLIQVLGLRFQPIAYEDQSVAWESLDDWLYELQWQPQERPIETPLRPVNRGSWLVFADTGGVGEALAARLEASGERCLVIWPGKAYEKLDDKRWQIRPDRPKDMAQFFETALGENLPPCRGAVHLWSLDAPSPKETTTASLEWAQTLGCGSAIHLIQQLDRAEWRETPRLWLVTRGAQPVLQEPAPLAVAQSPLGGLGRTIALEHASLWGGSVDLDPDATVDKAAERLWQAIWSAGGEDQLAFRRGQRHVVRLVRKGESSEQRRPLQWRPDAGYLITGGLGDLGLEFARWMVEQGARHLILMQRTELPPSSTWDQIEQDDHLAQKISAVRELESLGATVHLAAVDVADEAALRAFFEAYRREGRPPIRGVVHSAGLVEPQMLAWMDVAALNRVLQPKVLGGWLLHQLLAETPLDFFVLFSSEAALLSSPLLASYAAANAFLDALAHHRRAQGQPALSINWGPWSEVGMTARYQQEEGRELLPRGIKSLAPAQGLEIFGQLLAEDLAQVAVMPVNWREWSQYHPAASRSPLVAHLTEEQRIVSVGAESTTVGPEDGRASRLLRDQLRETPQSQQQEALEDYLRQQLARILHMKADAIPSDRNVMELGLDSIMVMELMRGLERDLQFKLYPREIFERPSIGALAEYLLVEFRRVSGQDTSSSAAQAETDAFDVALSLLSRPGKPRRLPKPAQRNPSMVFLLSAPRSGSTLLRVMLAGHPSLFSPPELHLLPFDTMQERKEELGLTYLGEGLQRAFMELQGCDGDASNALIEDLTAQDMPIQQVYGMLQELAGMRLLVDKSPSYGASIETLERAELLFEGAKYVCLVRHPYAMIESAMRIRLDKLLTTGEVDPLAFSEQVWRMVNGNILGFLRQIDPQRGLVIRYEDLVGQPAEATRQLCEFLDIPFDEVLLRPYQGNRMTDGVHNVSWGVGDPNFLKHNKIDSTLGEVWRDIVLPRRLDEKTRRLAAELKYELPVYKDAPFSEPDREKRPASETPTSGIVRVARQAQQVTLSSQGELEISESLKREVFGKNE